MSGIDWVERNTQDWRVIGGVRKYFRSKWEANYARYLQWLKERGEIREWQHEPTTFYFEGIKRGVTNYKPDFLVTHRDGRLEYVEVKGYETDKDRTKYKRMQKYHPEVKLRVVRSDWFSRNNKTCRGLIKDWE